MDSGLWYKWEYGSLFVLRLYMLIIIKIKQDEGAHHVIMNVGEVLIYIMIQTLFVTWYTFIYN